MEKLKGRCTHYTVGLPEFPAGLKCAEEVSISTGFPTEKLIELTDSMFIPHYRCGDGEAMYKIKEVKDWLAENMLIQFHGKKFPHKISVLDCLEPADSAPRCISHIEGLCEIKSSLPGVYFLIDVDELVYIGQSVNPALRVESHIKEASKKFTHSYYLPVPVSDLNGVEGALIRFFKPKYNISIRDNIVAPAEVDDLKVLESFGLNDQEAA